MKNSRLLGWLYATFNEFKTKESGVTTIEYALVITGIATIVIIIFGQNGQAQKMIFSVYEIVIKDILSAL